MINDFQFKTTNKIVNDIRIYGNGFITVSNYHKIDNNKFLFPFVVNAQFLCSHVELSSTKSPIGIIFKEKVFIDGVLTDTFTPVIGVPYLLTMGSSKLDFTIYSNTDDFNYKWQINVGNNIIFNVSDASSCGFTSSPLYFSIGIAFIIGLLSIPYFLKSIHE